MAERFNGSLLGVVQALRQREISAVELTQTCLRRIEHLQPQINAFIHIEADYALTTARAADRRLSGGDFNPGLLEGVPIARKDLFERAGQRATCASLLRRDRIATDTAPCLQKLDSAGAVDLGGLNMSEFALDIHGRNRLRGPVRNPWDTARTAGGSSGGSAAAVAAGMLFGALGSDTGGSIRSPAALCGVVGLVPTAGLLNSRGMFSACPSLDTPGPIARTVEDCARLLRVLTGSATAEKSLSYETQLAAPIHGRRIGVPTNIVEADLDMDVTTALQCAIEQFATLGAQIRDVVMPDLGSISALSSIVLGAETAATHKNDVRERARDYTPVVLDRLLLGFTYEPEQYAQALRARAAVTQLFCDSIFSQADVLLLPSAPDVAPTFTNIDAGSDMRDPGTFTRFSNFLGLPALALPCGSSSAGLPLGMQIIGRPYSEELLLNLGAAYQNATDFHRRRPSLAGA